MLSIQEQVQSGRLLSEFSTFGIGGPIRFYLEAKTIDLVQQALQWALEHQIPYFILGKGSNCLFDDTGFPGIIIHNKVDFIEFQEENEQVRVGAGRSFSLLGRETAKRGWHGLEFACGIPGSVGGAIYMNAGANGQETDQTVQEVTFLDEKGEKITLKKEEMAFSYRSSCFQTMSGCILAARFSLTLDKSAKKRQSELLLARKKSQPLQEKSAGCIFRNPSLSCSAGSLIDRCGLKGMMSGGAKVSDLHANFIVNANRLATSKDVLTLIEVIQHKVFETTGIWLEPEIRHVVAR